MQMNWQRIGRACIGGVVAPVLMTVFCALLVAIWGSTAALFRVDIGTAAGVTAAAGLVVLGVYAGWHWRR
jgi:hypothetical protein